MLRAEKSGIQIFQHWQEILLFSTPSRLALGPNHPAIPWGLFPGGEGGKVARAWGWPLVPYAFMVMYRDNFNSLYPLDKIQKDVQDVDDTGNDRWLG
jgi:hypothetical protein